MVRPSFENIYINKIIIIFVLIISYRMYLFMWIHATGVAKRVMDLLILIAPPVHLTQTNMKGSVNAHMGI